MNAEQMLDIIGEAKGSYVMEAQSHRERKPGSKARLQSKWKLLLIAALVAVLLTGCAVVYVLRLENMKIGTEEYADIHDPQPKTHTVLSLQGLVGSDNYNACKEWFDFLQTYELDYNTSSPLNQDEELTYSAYTCYDRQMADKIDEICGKYNLQLHGKAFFFGNGDGEEMYEFLGINGVLKDCVETKNACMSSYFYQEGSFRIEGELTLTAADAPWTKPVYFSYDCVMKNVFDDVFADMIESEIIDQWNYTTKDGTEVLLVLTLRNACIFMDRHDAFISAFVSDPDSQGLGMDKSQLEGIAEIFNYAVRPQPLDESALEAAREQERENNRKWREDHPNPSQQPSYAKYAKYYISWLETNRNYQIQCSLPVDPYYEPFYTLRDVNGDGEEELLIYQNEIIQSIVSMEDGITYELSDRAGSAWGLELCENDVLIQRFISVDGPEMCTIFRYKGDREQYIKFMMHRNDGWYDCPSMNPISDEAFDTKMTGEEFLAAIDLYTKIDLKRLHLKPLKELAGSE